MIHDASEARPRADRALWRGLTVAAVLVATSLGSAALSAGRANRLLPGESAGMPRDGTSDSLGTPSIIPSGAIC